jgi:hypothetical protein
MPIRKRPEQFLGVRIPLPPLDEQRRIVERLDRISALVDERRSAIEAAERETQVLLLKAFQRAIDGAPLRPMAEVAPLVRRPVEIDLDASYPELGVRSFGRGTFHKPELPCQGQRAADHRQRACLRPPADPVVAGAMDTRRHEGLRNPRQAYFRA